MLLVFIRQLLAQLLPQAENLVVAGVVVYMALHTGHLKESLHEMLFKSIDNKILIGKVLDEPRIQAGVESIPGCIPQFCLVIGFDLA